MSCVFLLYLGRLGKFLCTFFCCTLVALLSSYVLYFCCTLVALLSSYVLLCYAPVAGVNTDIFFWSKLIHMHIFIARLLRELRSIMSDSCCSGCCESCVVFCLTVVVQVVARAV